MLELIEKNLNYLFLKKVFFGNNKKIKQVVKKLNKDRLILISGMKFCSKTKFILELIKRTKTIKTIFYFNKNLDNFNKIKDKNDLEDLIDTFTLNYKKPKIIILQNINKIAGVKGFIAKLYKKNKTKIIIVGNNIEIQGIKNIEIYTRKIRLLSKNISIKDLLKYGSIDEILFIKDIYFKDFFIKSITDSILSDIIYTYSIKDDYLYRQTLSILSKIDSFISLRELHRILKENNINISLKTLIDYINFSLNSKLIKKINSYDLKQDKIGKTKAKYYFNDLGIRNNIYGKTLPQNILLENLVFNELTKKGYNITSGINGKFHFSFIVEKKGKIFYIHISKVVDKKEIKKEVKKLLKIGNNIKKYILVESVEKLKLKKTTTSKVEIVEISDFLENF